ncbi:UDP:flavonoid glycosyltransferase YjiC, YdhE family [Streptomyces misionensis]|uniref:UDP:flavonoid glycosyltransferase YjiC, YdhE family n=1 Tax=Streptomyces misionensis TaxID=67331 RepID=A0A1H4IAK6_9ACTN|nr:nucleotide disphospho-sugar-binding domain-containing protein [Streptomyces misionensis]SEB31003.1 UDP:flavonoid glycosyltransferase YjiC, YdhE family [Streptomyces misionensis]
MRVLFTVSAWRGHWYPLVPLGWALQASGHEVRVACAPSQSTEIGRAGLVPVPVLGEVDMMFLARLQNVWNAQEGTWPYPAPPPHPVTGEPMRSLAEFTFADFTRESGARLAEPARRGFDAAVGLARRWRPDLVVHELLSLEGVLAARVTGVPSVLHLWGPVGTDEDEPGLRLRPDDPTGAFRRHGAGEFRPDFVRHVIDPCPAGLRPRTDAARLPMRYVPYNGPGAVPRLAPPRPGRPRVCVIWGNSATRVAGPQAFRLPEVLAALTELDADVVLTAPAADVAALGQLPPSVTVLAQCPLHLLLPGCDAVVHHGGAGAVMTATAAGVPQMVMACAMDQFLNARRVAAAGAGLALPAHRADAVAVRAAVGELLGDPGHRERAARLRDEMRALPSPAQLVRDLAALAAR